MAIRRGAPPCGASSARFRPGAQAPARFRRAGGVGRAAVLPGKIAIPALPADAGSPAARASRVSPSS